ncbi:chorismate--pyruvate lyase family protein [Rheinheimera sp.]|uniref:chorismate--pyruvate lyase family protein n=1 Tax=Rheinheimera sp. TaxID=1869214 RepID=UPI002FDD922D
MMPPVFVVDHWFMLLSPEHLFESSLWRALESASCPPVWLPWLSAQGSLTRLLKAYKPGFHLQLLQQQHQPLPAALVSRWQCSHGLCREVLMSLDGQPAVFAQSWLPDSTIAALQPLAMLGEQPLGEYIFTQPGLSRGGIEVLCLPQGLQLPAVPGAAHTELWGRRSYFSLQQHEFLVQEIFLTGWLD